MLTETSLVIIGCVGFDGTVNIVLMLLLLFVFCLFAGTQTVNVEGD